MEQGATPRQDEGLLSVLNEARDQARDQLMAAWQIEIAKLEEALHSSMEERAGKLLGEQFRRLGDELAAQLEARVELRVTMEVEAAIASETRNAARSFSGRLNQAIRRLRQSEKQQEWSSAVADAAAPYVNRVIIFSVQGSSLRVEKASFALATMEIPLEAAPALAEAANTMEPLAVAYTERELSGELVEALGTVPGPMVYLFPIASQGRSVGLVYAEGSADCVDVDALELIATMAGTVLEARSAAAPAPGNGLISIQHSAASPRKSAAPSWADLPPAEQDLHLRAQRFARVQVAEIRLFQSAMVKQGRTNKSLYRILKEQIEPRREEYRRQFLKDCPSMVDYLHVEMVRTLANDKTELLGTEYPGPLV